MICAHLGTGISYAPEGGLHLPELMNAARGTTEVRQV